MPRTEIDDFQAENEFLLDTEHTALGDGAPHHAREHSLHSQADHTNIGSTTPQVGNMLVWTGSEWDPAGQAPPGPPQFVMSYSHNGTLDNDWMGVTELTAQGRTIALKCELIAIGFADKDVASIDIKIYKNGRTVSELMYTWAVSTTKSAYVNLVTPIQWAKGDVIDLYGATTGIKPKDTSLDLIMQTVA